MPFAGHWYVIPILLIIALIVFGPKRLPELGEGLGKAIKEFRKATSEMGNSIRDEVHHTDTAVGTTYLAPVTPATPVAVETPVTAPLAAAGAAPATAPPAAAVVPPEAPRT